MLESSLERIRVHASQLLLRRPLPGDRACSVGHACRAALRDVWDDGDADLHWLKQDRIDCGEEACQTTDQQRILAVAKRIKQLEIELAVARKINDVFPKEGISPKGSSRPGRASMSATPAERSACLNWLLRLEGRPDSAWSLRRIWLAGEIADVHNASGAPMAR